MGTLALGIDDCLLLVARVDVEVASSAESRLRADEVEFIRKEEGAFLAAGSGLSAIGWAQCQQGCGFLQVAFASSSYHHYPDLRL